MTGAPGLKPSQKINLLRLDDLHTIEEEYRRDVVNENNSITYRVNGSRIIHEAFSGEVIIGHLERGHYFSTEGTGALIWQLATTGHTQTAMINHLAGRYAIDPATLSGAVEAFLAELMKEGLLIPDTNGAAPPSPSLPEPGQAVYAPPVLHKYTDMEELLTMDPIHDVDESGWPNLKRPQVENQRSRI